MIEDVSEVFHHLIAAPGERFVPRELAARFAPIVGATALDLAQRLRYSGGWLWRDGEEGTVERLAAAAREHGIRCAALRTEGPIPPEATARVVTAELEGGRLLLELAHELVDISPAEVSALDLGIIGTRQPARTPKEEELHRYAEMALIGLSFPRQREALHGCGLSRPNPQLFISVEGRERFLRIERGTRFPLLVAESGPQAIDALFTFIDRLLAELPPGRALPELSRYWSEGTIEPLVFHRIEERENRLTWLRAWLRSREGEGAAE